MNIIKHRKVRAWADIERFGTVDITDLSVTYALNQIPSGSITLALGNDAVTGKLTPVHGWADLLHNKLKVQVYLRVGSDTKKVFDGFTAGAPFQRNYDSASFSVGLIGWLDDLMNSSSMSSLFAVGAPSDFFATASASISGAALFSATAAGEVLISYNVAADLWNTAKQALIILCGKALLTSSGDKAAGGGGTVRELGENANTPAIAALNKFSGDTLALVVNNDQMRNAVALNVGDVVFGPSGGETVWSKIMTLANLYGFAIVPTVESARAVAHVPFLKSSAIDMEVLADEYESLSEAFYSRDQLRGAVLLGTGGCITNVIDGTTKAQSHIMARYVLKEVGQLIVGDAPVWLTGEVSSEKWTPVTTGQGGNGVRATGTNPGSSAKTENESFNEMQENETIGQKYAQHMFLTNALAGRSISVTGMLRFDIAPGTPIKLETGGADLYGQKFLYGNVQAVTITAETRSPSAGTIIGIDNYHVNSEDDVAADGHPLYGTAFRGAALI